MAEILVVEDNSAVRMAYRLLLKNVGHSVTEAADGIEALNLLKKRGTVDLCVVDIYMPRMDGHQFVKAARADKAFAGLQILMATTETEMDHVAKALAAGADEYLMKPFSKEMLRDKLVLMKVLEPPLAT